MKVATMFSARHGRRDLDINIGPAPSIPLPADDRPSLDRPLSPGRILRNSVRDSATSLPTDTESALLSLNQEDFDFYQELSDDADESPTRPVQKIPPPYLPLRKSSMHRSRLNRLQLETSPQQLPPLPVETSPTPLPKVVQSVPATPINFSRNAVSPPLASAPLPHVVPSPIEYKNEDDISPIAALPRTRARGFTTTTPRIGLPKSPSVRKIKPATSIPDLHSFRNKPASVTHGERSTSGRGLPASGQASPSGVSPVAQRAIATAGSPGESRSSYRSAFTNTSHITYSSSAYVDVSETERSSVVTQASSFSGHSKEDTQQDADSDGGLSADDVLDMYINGFEDDPISDVLPEKAQDVETPRGQHTSADPVDALVETPQRFIEMSQSSLDDSLEVSPRNLRRVSSVPDLGSSSTNITAPSLASPRARSPSPALKSPTPPPKDFDFESSMFRRESHLSSSSIQIEPPLPIAKNLPELPKQDIPRDRYGFKKANQYITVEQYDAWNLGYSDYLDRRRDKWYKLMQATNHPTENPTRFPPKSDKVKRYIRKGIPPEWRGAAWFWYAGGPQYLVESPPGLYDNLVRRCEEGDLSDSDREHIERDLNRTFPDNIKFKPDVGVESSNENMPGRDVRPGGTANTETSIVRSLRRVLQAFAVHNPSIGYCQSLNFLAGLLLIFLDGDEEKAFVLLNIITNKHLPGTHAKVLEANVDIGVLMTCIQESMPAIWAKIDDKVDAKETPLAGLSATRLPTVSLATTAWFMSLFAGSLPIECVLRVWDVFFYEGSKTLFRIALAIFKHGEQEIRSVSDNLEILQVVQHVPRKLLDVNSLMETCYRRKNGFGHLGQETIDQRREERRWALRCDRARVNGEVLPGMDVGSGVKSPGLEGKGFGGGLRRAATRAKLMRSVSRKRVPTMPI